MQIPEPQVEGSKRRSPTKPGEVEDGHSRLGGEQKPSDGEEDDKDDDDDEDDLMMIIMIVIAKQG